MTVICAGLMLGLLLFSQEAMQAALAAAECFVRGVMPALLPMMVLGRMLPPPRGAAGAVAYAMAAGSPAAAQRAAELRGRMSARGWESLLCLTGVMSPMFFTGTLAGWLGSARAGWGLLLAHWAGAWAAAALWAAAAKPAPLAEAPAPARAERAGLSQAIAQSAQAMLCVLGAMMVFSVAAGLLRSAVWAVFPGFAQRHAPWLCALWAAMEIGGGSAAVIGAWEKPHALLSGLCGFGGLSIWLQNLLFLDKSIRPARLLAMRAVHGAVSYALVSFFLKIQNLLMT